jgi:hypothetical protein
MPSVSDADRLLTRVAPVAAGARIVVD